MGDRLGILGAVSILILPSFPPFKKVSSSPPPPTSWASEYQFAHFLREGGVPEIVTSDIRLFDMKCLFLKIKYMNVVRRNPEKKKAKACWERKSKD